jgi:hypothetical protein
VPHLCGEDTSEHGKTPVRVFICLQEFWICILLWYRTVLQVDTSATEEHNVLLWNVGNPSIRQHGVIRLSGCLCFGKMWCLHIRIKQSKTLSAEGSQTKLHGLAVKLALSATL